jgi:hypothetical protein
MGSCHSFRVATSSFTKTSKKSTMKKPLLLLFVILQGLSFAQSTQKSVLDTMVFDLANATTYSGTGGTYLEFPVYAVTTGGISNFDFWFQFNETKLTYDTTTAVDINLDTYSNFNTSNHNLSNTTSGPSLTYSVQGNTPLIKLRFILATAGTTVDTTDFFACTALFNGNPCNFYWTASNTNTGAGITNLTAVANCNYNLQNPSIADVYLADDLIENATILSFTGQTVWKSEGIKGVVELPFSSLANGNYFLQIKRKNNNCSQRISILK